ncbi:AAA family ATPase [Oxalobacteraceae bacterium CAVE-383]|nr:AAA family ATPase [Oxalobacteraceae bacterium CAVE-383]
MNFEIPEPLVNALLESIDAQSPLAKKLHEQSICHGRMLVSSKLFDGQSLNTLFSLSKTHDERALMFEMLALDNIFNAPQARIIPSIEVLAGGLIAYFSRDVIDGWLYHRNKDGVLLPWLIHSVRHVVPDQGSPFVIVDLLANTMQSASIASPDHHMLRSGMTNSIVIYRHEIANRTIPELLAEFGYFKECHEFKQEYEAHAQRFLKFQARFGAQFIINKTAFLADSKQQLEMVKIKPGITAKCINDEETIDRRFEMMVDNQFWRDANVTQGFEKIPLHCYVYLFHLEWHCNIWVHVQNMAEYRYQPDLREKLILPAKHRDLIDILTSSMNILVQDFVPGKSGGTTILCKGAPGLGKTLTAEVYSEVVGKPLYRVHSGQLGISAASVERNLMEILRRAVRWDAILLLDEADVYIRCRDNDLEHNAIVAEFLRTLEYFNGLLFMTTNRIDDVDDAILSRCIATIQYETPTKDDAVLLWKSLALQFNADLSADLIERLTTTYAAASGRDIKELLKLTSKFCKAKDIPFSEDAFRQCAVFRGYA